MKYVRALIAHPTGIRSTLRWEITSKLNVDLALHELESEAGDERLHVQLPLASLASLQSLRSASSVLAHIAFVPSLVAARTDVLHKVAHAAEEADLTAAISALEHCNPSLAPIATSNRLVKFRATVERGGQVGTDDGVTSVQMAQTLGSSIQQRFGWAVDLDHPDMNLVLRCNNRAASLALHLGTPAGNKKPHKLGVPLPVAMHLLRLAIHPLMDGESCSSGFGRLQQACILLDPMCGTGAIAAVAAEHGCVSIASDMRKKQLVQCKALAYDMLGENAQNVQSFRADARNLPLADASVDAVVLDPPFGKRHTFGDGIVEDVLSEVARVLKPGCYIGMLVTHKLLERARQHIQESSCQLVERTQPESVSLGGEHAFALCLERAQDSTTNGLKLRCTDSSRSRSAS